MLENLTAAIRTLIERIDTIIVKDERRGFIVGEPLPRHMGVSDMCRAFSISRSHFHRLERDGKFERFELKPQIGAKAWSGTLVQRYLDCEANASRFVTTSLPRKQS